MEKNRIQMICLEIKINLESLINELGKDIPHYNYLNEKLENVENDILLVRKTIEKCEQ